MKTLTMLEKFIGWAQSYVDAQYVRAVYLSGYRGLFPESHQPRARHLLDAATEKMFLPFRFLADELEQRMDIKVHVIVQASESTVSRIVVISGNAVLLFCERQAWYFNNFRSPAFAVWLDHLFIEIHEAALQFEPLLERRNTKESL